MLTIFLEKEIEMRNKKILLLATVSVLVLMVTSSCSTYRCIWSEDVWVCGNELGLIPSVGGESGGSISEKVDLSDRRGDLGGITGPRIVGIWPDHDVTTC